MNIFGFKGINCQSFGILCRFYETRTHFLVLLRQSLDCRVQLYILIHQRFTFPYKTGILHEFAYQSAIDTLFL